MKISSLATELPTVSRVGSRVQRLWSICAVGCLALAVGCGGKDKKESTTTAAGSTGSTGEVSSVDNPEDIDPIGGDNAAGGGDSGGDGAAAGDPAGGDGGDDPGAGGNNASAPPEIKPPGLDLTPAQKRARTSKHISKARKALSGGSKDPTTAITEAKAALQIDETSVDAMLLLAHANYLKGYYDQAEDILDKAAKRGGKDRKLLWFLKGLTFQKTDQNDRAFTAFDKAVSIDPNYKPAVLNLGVHYLMNKRYSQAVELYERLTGDLGFNRAVAWVNLASGYRGLAAEAQSSDITKRNKLVLKAETTYKRAISVEKKYAPAYYNLGLLYLDSDPFPTSNGDMDMIKRLKRAKTYFDEYRRLPGADGKLADAQVDVATKLIQKEEKKREKLKKLKEMEEKMKKLEEAGGDEGFE